MIFDYISDSRSLPFEQNVVQNFTPELQWSPNFMVGFIFNGQITIHYEKHSREFKEHDLFFFMPMQSFSTVSSDPDTRALILVIDTKYIEQLCPEFSQMTLTQNHLRLNLSNSIYVSLCTDLATIIFNNLKKEYNTKMLLLRAATHIAETIIGNFGLIQNEKKATTTSIDRQTEILRYIEDHYRENISVTDISRHLGLHPQYFSTYFRKQFSVNFVDYINSHRVNSSIYDLCYTDESVLNIALNYGFNSHKTYSTVFKRLYNCTPMEYRKSNRHSDYLDEIADEVNPNKLDHSGETFGFFRQFLVSDNNNTDNTTNHIADRNQMNLIRHQQTITLNPDSYEKTATNLNHYRVVSVGRAFSILRAEFQQQILNSSKEIPYDYLRIRDIFSDDLYVYHEDENQNPVYNWNALDNIFDFIISLGIHPLVEVGFMPKKLAAKQQYAGFVYHPNVSKPKRYSAWSDLISAFLTHYLNRYGSEELEKWYFSFWTTADLVIPNPYWNETQEEFFKFYEVTYKAFDSVSPNLRFGTPNFSAISGFDWYESFFQFCYVNKLYPKFVDFHSYGTKTVSEFRNEDYSNLHTEGFTMVDRDNINHEMQKLHTIMNRCGFRTLDVIISDWNLSFLPTDLIRDTCYMGPFICHTMIHSLPHAKAMSFWALSDIHDEAIPGSKLFPGGPGMMDYHGLRKASFNALSLLSQLGQRILTVGDNYIFTRTNNRYQILIYNIAEFDDMYSKIDKSAIDEEHRYQIFNEKDIYLNIIVDLPAGTYYVKRSEVNRRYGSAYDLWNEMGAPKSLHKELEDYLREYSVPHVSYSVKEVDSSLLLAEEVPAHGVLLIELMPK